MKSYASLRKGFSDTLSEFWHVYRHKTGDVAGTVASVVNASREMESLAEQKLGLGLQDLEMLEIGAGQQLLRSKYFSTKNRVTAVDYDVVLQGLDPAACWKVLRKNGAKRLVKTVLRKAAGIDRAYWRELEKHAGPKVRERLPVVQGDAHALPWPDSSFDFTYSFSVFEHLADPAKCLEEAVRVLRPGGGFCIGTHLYTSDSGAHDPRTFVLPHSEPPYWAHLRPAYQNNVKPNATCNRWRLSQWEGLFRKKCPGVVFEHKRAGTATLEPELSRLRSRGELREYTDPELLTVDIWALWRKR